MIHPHFQLTQADWDSRNFGSLAALLLLILETLALCEKEYKWIWRSPGICIVKVAYLFARYYGLVMMSVNYILVHTLLANAPVSSAQCRAWYIYLFLSGLSLKIALDVVVLIQVYALYHKTLHGSRKIYFLFAPIVALLAAVGFMTSRSALEHRAFTPLCSLRRTPPESAFFGSLVLIIQTSLWSVMYAKRNLVRGSTVLLRLVVRGGTLTFVVLFGLIATVIPLVFISRTCNPFLIFVWPSTLMSIVTCRLVIAMRSLNVRSRTRKPADTASNRSNPTDEETFPLTTIILTNLGTNDELWT